ncbi:MAG: type I restriction-modification system subunit M [Bacteroidales bacterium]
MAIKKSELYSTLWKSCDELRGGMDASQYKDYVLVILFVKYVSDKYKNNPDSLIEIPEGCSFDDFVALKGKSNIGEELNIKMAALAGANDLSGVINLADFCDEQKLGKGKDLVDTVSNLIGVFQSSGLDFGKNRANDDDLMGDAYEYLMKHFASDSGKSKGQFYTPSEVSRIMAKVIGLQNTTSKRATIYDPTCGSGSLLLKALAETPHGATLYGQEKDSATVGLAKMNMILHGEDLADIRQGDTINNPQFKSAQDNSALETYDFVVANPPFSTKSWLKSAKEEDEFGRWNRTIGMPPEKNGDFAFLLHIIRSMNMRGQGACILPHGVLFRGNGEATIRKYIVDRGLIKGIIGLPANLFYGTGIPACIVVLDKKQAADRTGIFMIDAKAGYAKDGPKNRLREQDVRRIVDVWNAQKPVAHYARFVEKAEIVRNDYNLNLPRYIESEDAEILQDIEAHLRGGLPRHDIEQLQHYWGACPALKKALFAPMPDRKGYYSLQCDKAQIREAVQQHPDFMAQTSAYRTHYDEWKAQVRPLLEAIDADTKPKELIQELGNLLLDKFAGDALLVENYDVYEQLLTYWNETMQDDVYLVVSDGWKAELYTPQPAAKKDKDGNLKKVKVKVATTPEEVLCDLLPVSIVIDEYFADMKALITAAEEKTAESETALNELLEEEAENFLDSSNFANDTINDGNVKKRIRDLKGKPDTKDELKILEKYLQLKEDMADGKRVQKALKYDLLIKLADKYKALTEDEIRCLVVEKKWLASLAERLDSEMQQISQNLTTRVSELAERYAQTLPAIDAELVELEEKVKKHLSITGFTL